MKWSAAWGAACDPCARAKSRCVRSEGANDPKCSRCQSLNISCTQQVRKPRKRRLRQNAPALPSSAVPQLGQKHDGFNDTADSTRGYGTPPLTSESNLAVGDDQHSHATEPEPNVYVAQVKPEPTRAFSAPTSLPGFHPFPTPTCTCISEADGIDDLGPVESDEALLSIYRTRLSPQFPFVVVPDDITAVELRRTRPFLAKAIRMVASMRHRRSMWSQSKQLLRQISDAVFMGPDRSLDLLQCLIVYLGFFHYFCFAHGHFNGLSHLASSMIADMRLDRPRRRPALRNKNLQGIDPEEPKAMSNDERRAVLAVWYLNSSYVVAFQKVNSPGRHFTQHMQRLLQELQGEPEYGSDEVLVQLIYAQRANEMIAQLQQSDQSVDIRPSANAWAANLDNLLAELHTLQDSKDLVPSHHNFAMLQLLEPQLLDSDHMGNHEAVAALRHTPDYFRTPSKSTKDAADTALRDWFEHWLTIPVCHYFYMSVSAYLQLTNVTVVLLRRARLLLLARYRQAEPHAPETYVSSNVGGPASPGIDAEGGSDDLLLDLLVRLASRFEEARIEMAAAHCSEWDNDFLDLVAWKLRERKECIEKWIRLIGNETNINSRGGIESWEGHRPGPLYGDGGDLTAFQTMDEQGQWLDPLEALLMGGGDAYESWM